MSESTTDKNKAGKTWAVVREATCAAQRLNSDQGRARKDVDICTEVRRSQGADHQMTGDS